MSYTDSLLEILKISKFPTPRHRVVRRIHHARGRSFWGSKRTARNQLFHRQRHLGKSTGSKSLSLIDRLRPLVTLDSHIFRDNQLALWKELMALLVRYSIPLQEPTPRGLTQFDSQLPLRPCAYIRLVQVGFPLDQGLDALGQPVPLLQGI